MLTPEYLKNLPENVIRIMQQLEDDIIADIARRISGNLKLTATAEYQIEMLTRMGYDIEEIKKELAKRIDIASNELENILKEASYLSYENDQELYKRGGKDLPPLDDNLQMKRFIEATIQQTKGQLKNFTNTTGFIDNGKFKLLDNFYRDTLDYAVFQLGSGAFDYNTVLKQTVKKLGDSGLRTIDYKSGRAYHIESATRMSIMTAISQITGYMSLANAQMLGQDLMEITAHAGARPSHAVWQGQIVSLSGRRGYLSLSDIGYGEPDGFKGVNCRHDWYPFFEGISEPAYTKEQLENIDPPPFEFEGRFYTFYEANQKQRQIERAIRKTKRELIAYEAAGLKDDFTAASIKLRRQRELYRDFSRAANLREKLERTGVYGYNKNISSKSVWVERKEREYLQKQLPYVINGEKGFIPTNTKFEITKIIAGGNSGKS